MFNHEQMQQLISAYTDNEVSLTERQEVEAHLKECASCQKYLSELQMVKKSLKIWSNETLSPDLEQKIKQGLAKAQPRGGGEMKNSKRAMALSLTAVMVVVAMVYVTVYQGKTRLAKHLNSAVDDIGDKFILREVGKKLDKKTWDNNIRREKSQRAFEYQQLAKVVRGADGAGKDELFEKQNADRRGTVQSQPSTSELAKGIRDEKVDQEFWGKPSGGGENIKGALNVEYMLSDKFIVAETRKENFNTEQYDRIDENGFLAAKDNPLSTFSIDVDTASYSNVRRFLNDGQLPPQDAVRIEEMINYFTYDYPQPKGDGLFSLTTQGAKCPWNKRHDLVLVGLQGKKVDLKELPPNNLVFLIDVSGSMQPANKLPLLKKSFELLVEQLRRKDRVSIVVYAGAAGVVLDSTPGSEKEEILEAIDRLEAGGSTAGGAGIELAYRIAQENFITHGNNRVILATDGDFNVGVSNDDDLVRIIEKKRNEGIYLTVLGFGMGNYKDSKMEKLADKGNGNYAYIDNRSEAEKVFVNQLGGTLLAIAKDVKIQIEFNPAKVKAYRLVGYENRMLKKEDFNDDRKDAGELGAGHSVTALYEIIPAGVDDSEEVDDDGDTDTSFSKVDPLKYQATKIINSGDLMTVKLRYKEPKEETSQLLQQRVKAEDIAEESPDENFQFASAVAEFGLLLRDSEYKARASYDQVLRRAKRAIGEDEEGYRTEFIGLVKKAQSLSAGQWSDRETMD